MKVSSGTIVDASIISAPSSTKNADKQVIPRCIRSEAIATDATTQLTHVKSANPQAVVVWTTLPSATVVMKAYRDLSLPYPIYYSDGSANGAFLVQDGLSTFSTVLTQVEKQKFELIR
jgi:hypothetical protein